ncbi:conjugal transfer protein TraF [Pontiellaceae bacterium B12219]|nr:conjugal transfer protein TraF [Pontiellaceae bacterium B12219]
MKAKFVLRLGVGLFGIMAAQQVLAEHAAFVGHRAQGMGGAGVATVNDSSAQWQNPAAFGFFSRDPDPVQGAVTNAVTNVVAGVAAPDDTNSVATASDGAETNTVVSALIPTTNITYDITMGDIIPERARVDNAHLAENDWGWNLLGIGVGYTMTEDMPEYITQIGLIDGDSFDGEGLAGTTEGVESMLLVGSALYGLAGNPDNAFYVDTTAGMNFRIGKIGFGIRAFGEAAGFVDYLDTANLGVEQSEAEFIAAINVAASSVGFNPGTWNFQTISANALNISTNGVSGQNAAKYIDYQYTQLKNEGVVTEQNIDDSVFMANQVTYNQDPDDPTSSSIENNKSTVTARGFGLVEVPISYGYAFNDNFSIGITAKGMYGTVTGTKVQVLSDDPFESAADNLEENTEASFNFGLDLGALYRMKMLQFGVVAHNINAPTFKGFNDTIEIKNDAGTVIDTVAIDVPDYTMDPQVTLGMAFIPSKRFMLEMSYDVLETGTLLKNYNIQRLSFGGELDLWLLALRLGAYNNLAAEWQDWVATAGVGVNLWAMRLDVGGAYSIGANAEYEGTEIPEEARLYAAVSVEF